MNECFNAAAEAAGGKLTSDEVQAAFDEILSEKERLQRAGKTDRMAERLAEFAQRKADQTKIAAAMQRRHAALNAIVRDRLDQTIDGFMRAGLPADKAILAIMEGTQRGVEGGRNSVHALQLAYEARYAGGMMAEIQRDVPHFLGLLADRQFDADVLREMAQNKEGGTPGITGNADAKKIAGIFAKYAELARTDLNKLGASIGKLDGWAGAQSHDDIKLIAAGKDAWVDQILPLLDLDRTFDGAAPDEARGILGDIYDTIVTGMPNKPTPREVGQRVNPANLAKSLGKSRVLHFRDAEAALAYRDKFGYGNTIQGIWAHLRKSARLAAQMETFGPNPEVMFNAIIESTARKIKEGDFSPAEKSRAVKKLRTDGGKLRAAFDVMSGMASRPVNVTAAKISTDIRAFEQMAKLGGAVITAFPTDTMTNALASQFRGGGFLRGLQQQIKGILSGRGPAEQREVSFLLGEGFDGLLGHIVNPAAAEDGPIGSTSRWSENFFRFNGLNWWTDVSRASTARMVAAEMGMRAETPWADLPANYRHVLGLHAIDEQRWNMIRKAGAEKIGDNRYITPDLVRDLDDETVSGLFADRLAAAKTDEQRARVLDDARFDLEMKVRAFVADEVNYGTLETDAASRRLTTWGATRPGTIAGEAARFIMQFKGFPIAFAQRIVGRAVLGQSSEISKWQRAAHIGTLLGGMTMAGYMAMTMKDILRGYWPPRDPSDVKTIIAAMQQGGALGVYGDYLFGTANRFGGGFTETLAGPAIGSVGDFINLAMKARNSAAARITGAEYDNSEKARLADFVNFGINNTPFINLFYTRPALDYLFLSSLREVASPGYLRRQAATRRKEYGQETVMPDHLRLFGR